MNSVWKTIVASLASYWKENTPDVCPELGELHKCVEASQQELKNVPQWQDLLKFIKGPFPLVVFNDEHYEDTDVTLLGLILLINYSRKVPQTSIEGLSVLSRNQKTTISHFLRCFSDVSNEAIDRNAIITEICKRSSSPRKRRRRGRKGDKSTHSEQRNTPGALSGDEMFGDGGSDNNEGNEQLDSCDSPESVQALKDTIAELEDEKASLISTLENKNRELEKIKELEGKLGDYKMKSEELKEVLDGKTKALEENQNEMLSVKSQLARELCYKKELEESLNDKSQEITSLEEKVTSLFEGKKEMTEKYNTQVQECLVTKHKFEESLEVNKELKDRFEKTLQDKEELFRSLSDKDKEINALNVRLDTVTKEKGLLDVEVLLKEKYIRRIEEQVSALEAENEPLTAELKKLKSNYNICNQELSDTQTKVERLEELNDDNSLIINRMEWEIQALDEKWKSSAAELDQLRSVEATTKTEIDTLRFYNEQLTKSNDLKSSQISEKNTVISRLTDRCEGLLNDITVLKSNFEMKTKDILVLDEAFIEKKAEVDGLRCAVKSLEDKLEEKDSEIGSLKTELNEKMVELNSWKEKCEEMEFSNGEKVVHGASDSDGALMTFSEIQDPSLPYLATNECMSLNDDKELTEEDESVTRLESRIKDLEVNNHSINLINDQLKEEVEKLVIEKSELTDLVGKLRLELEATTKKKKKKTKLANPQTSKSQDDKLECSEKKSKKFTLMNWPLLGNLFPTQKSSSNVGSKVSLQTLRASDGQNGDAVSGSPVENSQSSSEDREVLEGFNCITLDSKVSQVCLEFLSLSYILFTLLCSSSVILVSKVAKPFSSFFKASELPTDKKDSENNECDVTKTSNPVQQTEDVPSL